MANDQFPIVGIGASAGGLKALEALFRGMPADTGMAFVIVTHMAPGKESTLPEILGRFTAMPVASAQDGAAIQPNQVYVLPPDHVLPARENRLGLTPLTPALHRFPIDLFLSSLAENFGEAAIGILLSGGGSDGTVGIRAIKEHGGLTVAQGHNGSRPQATVKIESGERPIPLHRQDSPSRPPAIPDNLLIPKSESSRSVPKSACHPAIAGSRY